MKLKLLITSIPLSLSLSSLSQNADKKWGVGLHAIFLEPRTLRGDEFFRFDLKNNDPGASISLNRYLNQSLDLGLFLTASKLRQNDRFRFYDDEAVFANLRLRYKLYNGYLFKEDCIIGPYLAVGGGVALVRVDAQTFTGRFENDVAQPDVYGGAGIRFRLSNAVSIDINSGVHVPMENNIEGIDEGDNDLVLEHAAGIIINVGQSKDEDGDGVPDRKDKCPQTPASARVDENGCPIDTDKDGVADYVDECIDQPGSAGLKGCPDRDNDGVADKNDRCPQDPGLINLQGCPDSDADGVADADDKCGGTKAGYKVDEKGCPFDRDNDQVVDEEDECPDTAGVAFLKGCPDRDADGVADKDDKCPDVKGLASNDGCPEIPKEVVKEITRIASKIFFETNSDKLKSTSIAQLDGLVRILNQYPETNLTIEGHTDNTGSDEYNLTLSQKRTDSVKNYLVSKGIPESRLKAIGYGETQPISDNKTAAGRAANRRVELKTE